ncbi:bifunctional nuclease family protein [Candidatus Woesearchaeota archaeon]|uniref:Protein containing DUF151 n=1 Tax=Candidatus Syntropharchaeum caldarium TaxID=1838285 RepID=A0A1F2P962_9EURY|nr:MAG: protein containing DUF151 [Candidatus Syntrophoarchaeum caldarius]RLE41627.1 MAG: bifunctional nuclease family protein [Candidatus Woesearchaeota archaeon]
MDGILVEVKGVYLGKTPQGGAPLVLLQANNRVMPIYIGIPEAISISSALKDQTAPRPMTHDLIVSMLESLHCAIEGVYIDDFFDGIYYAKLTISDHTGSKELDARPSDCIAIALRTGTDIYVRKEIFEGASMDEKDLKDVDTMWNLI